ncbi:MAG: hypothetical protein ACP5OZ_02940 [Candidatus Woesearchaeota archaeon]
MSTKHSWEKEARALKGVMKNGYFQMQKITKITHKSRSHKQANKQASEHLLFKVLQDTAQAGFGMKRSCSESFSDTPNPKVHPEKTSKQLNSPAVLFFVFLISVFLVQESTTVSAANINIISPISQQMLNYGLNYVNFIINSNETFNGYVLYNLTSNLIPNEMNFTFEESDFENLSSQLQIINHTFLINATSAGYYRIEAILYKNGIFENRDYTEGTVFFDNKPPVILNKSPSGKLNNFNVILKLTTDENSNCSFSDDNETWILMLGNEKEHSYNLTSKLESEGDGDYFYYLLCQDNFGNKASSTINFSIDTTPPEIINSEPLNLALVNNNDVLIKITTDENSVCRYSSENTNFQSMNQMSDLKTTHTINLNLEDKEYTYYFLCKDLVENLIQEPFVLKFTVDTPPKAEVIFKDRISYGTFDVTVRTSEEVRNITFAYVLSSAPSNTIIVPLTGSGREYKGFVLIEEDAGEQIGSFYVWMEDYKGNKGTEITSGNIFIVDTIAPKKISVFKATPAANSARLSWYSEDKDISYYNIYRSENPGLTELDYYTKTTNDYFIDSIANPHYYAVRAVDKAGNIGAFSEELYVEPLKQANKIAVSQQSLNRIADKLRELQDIREKITGYEDILNSKLENERRLMNIFGTTQKIESAKSQIEQLIEQTNSLKESSLSDDDVLSELQKTSLKAKSLLSTAPKDFQIIEEKSIEQVRNYEDVVYAYKKIFGDENKARIDEAISKTKNLNIETKIVSAKITYENNYEEKTLIEEVISSDEKIGKSFIIEIIPKEIAESTSEISFLQNNYQIIENDPVIKFDFSDFNNAKISYVLNKRIYFDKAEKIRTIVLFPETTETEKASKLTGLMTFNISTLRNYSIDIGIVIGIIIIIFLLIYYLNMDSSQTTISKYDRTLPRTLLGEKEQISREHRNMHSTISAQYAQHAQHVQHAKTAYNTGTTAGITEITKQSKVQTHQEIEEQGRLRFDSFEEIKNSITTANKEIDNLSFDSSNRIYAQLNSLAFNNLEQDKIKVIKREMNNLQNKLTLYLKLEEAKQRAKSNERIHLKQVLTTIEVLYKLIKNFEKNSNTPLMQTAKQIYNAYRSDRLE